MVLQPAAASSATISSPARNVVSGASGASGGATSGLLGIGMRPGVRLTPNVSKCLRRPTKLATSLRMLNEGHDFDRCCDQLLLAHCFMEGGSTAGGQRSAGGSLFSEDESLGLDPSGQGLDDYTLERQHEAEEALLDAGYGIAELGSRLLNKARMVPPLGIALQAERALAEQQHSTATGASKPDNDGEGVSTSETTPAAAVASSGRTIDDDVATQLYLASYTLDDIRRQEAMLMEEARMVEALQKRFKDDESGQRLLAANLSGARVLVAPSPKRHVEGKHGAERTSRSATSSTANVTMDEVTPHHPHLLDAWKWSPPSTKRVLPPLVDPRVLAKGTVSPTLVGPEETPVGGCGAAALHSPTALLTSALRLAPLCTPVSFRPDDVGGIPQAASPLRAVRHGDDHSTASPASPSQRQRFRSSAVKVHARTSQPDALAASPAHEDGGAWNTNDAWCSGLSRSADPTINDAVVAAVLRASNDAWDASAPDGIEPSPWSEKDAEATVVWQFERNNCLQDVARQLSAFYGGSQVPQ